jgi:hypothetical protein
MSDNAIFQDGFKADALKMMEGAVFKHLIEVAKARIPEYANSTNDLHVVALQAKMREGYELAISTILALPHEVAPAAVNEYDRILLDPRD